MTDSMPTQTEPTSSVPLRAPATSTEDRAARLDALRRDLDRRIDEIVTARGERVPALTAAFAAAWKAFGAEIDGQST